MKIKKSWYFPQLIKYGTVEQLTEMQYTDIQQINQFIVNGPSMFGLFASLEGI